MTTGTAKVNVIVRSAVRIYLITAGLMFVGGAAVGALLAAAGYDLTHILN